MKRYENRSRTSPIVAYEFGENSITVKLLMARCICIPLRLPVMPMLSK